MADFFLVAAWAAGVVEGAAVLSHSEEKFPSYVLPAISYGTCALPLSIFGASPGPAMMASLPFAPIRFKDPDDSAERHAENIHHRSELFQKTRDQNKRALKADIRSITGRSWFAALDGQALPTPLAEAMRRTRFLLAGAGIVSAYLSYRQRNATESLETASMIRANDEKVILRLGAPHATVNKGVRTIPFRTNHPIHSYTTDSPLVLLEADIAPTLQFQSDNALAAANRLACHELLRNTTDVVNIVVGAGPCPPLIKDAIYLDGTSALATALMTSIESMYEAMTAKVPFSFWILVESIGSAIRQGIMGGRKQLHLLSDRPDVCVWLTKSLPGWRILWYDADNDADVYQYRKAANDQSMTCICCSRDEITMAYCVNTKWRHVICITEKEASEAAIHTLDESFVTLSVERIHAGLLENARMAAMDQR
jgi:hypothetical protein